MYIWVGINVDDQLLKIKDVAKRIENEIGFTNSNFTLPLHISLKISFNVEESIASEVIETISNYYNQIEPFEISIKGIEKHTTIVWIRMIRNKEIDKIHDDLNNMLQEKYGIGLHPYDLDYQFHTTLFMDNDSVKIAKAYEMVKDVDVPQSLLLSKFIIGSSPNGQLGTYKVIKTIKKDTI